MTVGLRRRLEIAAEEKERWVAIQVVFPADFLPAWNRVVDEAAERGVTHRDPRVLAGMVVEMLVAEYLAG